MASPNVYLFEMRNATVTSGNGDVFQLYVHVVLGYNSLACVSCTLAMRARTFNQLAAVDLARCNLERDNVALRTVSKRVGG
jgi:hypothetical protein